MSKKQNYLLKVITSIALIMVLSLALSLPAFADPIYTEGYGPDDPAPAAITKAIKMPVNTTIPSATFTFNFTKVGIDDADDAATKAKMPELGPLTVIFPGVAPNKATLIEDGGVRYAVLETEDFIAGLVSADWQGGEGIYRYQVEEDTNDTLSKPDEAWAIYSKAKYDIEVWVAADSDGDLYARFVVVMLVEDFIDIYYPGGAGGEKVDPTPGGHDQIPNVTTIEDDFSQVVFTNQYWKTTIGGDDDTDTDSDTDDDDDFDASLKIMKKVTGAGAEKDEYFSFTVKVTKPDMVVNDPPVYNYKAYIVNAEGKVVTSAANYSGDIEDDVDGDYFWITSGAEFTVKLKHGERIAFVDLITGSQVEVMEDPHANYKPTYKRSFAGTDAYPALTAGTLWGFPRTADPAPHYMRDGENNNNVLFTNNATGVTPTGISVDNLPYIVMIALAALALASYVALKTRKSAKNNA
jgi:hypothetical protein